ncbi:MAG: ParB/RepB/Spo0J family partition protein [Oscillospiraceae bacterium]|nr:ParB/RepB/Spo0J family partition protein [Oscillospiraceae bacterium]
MAKKGLGSGLDALFGGELPPEQAADLRTLPLQKVEPGEHQPRETFDGEKLEALADSIRTHGILQPISVRRLDGDRYQIIAGERRWRAARMAGLTEIPARILEADDREAAVLALVENLQREDLNPVEQAKGLRRLIEEYGCTQETAAETVGCSRPAVTNALRLLALPEAVLAMLEDGRLSAGHGRALLALGEEGRMLSTAEQVWKEGFSVRQTEALVKKLLAPPPAPKPKRDDRIYVKALEDRLTRGFGRKVHIVSGPKKGKLEIEYYGNEDLEALIRALGPLGAVEGEEEDRA